MLPELYNICQKKQITLVTNEIETLLVPLSQIADLHYSLRESLIEIMRRTTSDDARRKPWYLLPLLVCESINGTYEYAVPASAALLLFIAAAEIYDDVEDADAPGALSAKYGSAIATNLATTLLILAEKALIRLKERGVAYNVIIRITDVVNSLYLHACSGQHQDLSLSGDITIPEDIYLRVASTKSASTIECACHIGALAAMAGQEVVDLYVLFGRNLGMASQIANDLEGIMDGRDIANKKVTLPLIYTLAQVEGDTRRHLEIAFSKPGKSVLSVNQIRDLLFASGGVCYATIMMELYKQHALEALMKVGKLGVNVERLKSFM